MNENMMMCRVCGKEISKTAKVCPNCGESYEKDNTKEKTDVIKEYVKVDDKSRLISFFLTILFGNIGLFYASFKAGLILLVPNLFVLYGTLAMISKNDDPGIIFLITWYIIPILWGDSIIVKNRRRRKAEAKIMSQK